MPVDCRKPIECEIWCIETNELRNRIIEKHPTIARLIHQRFNHDTRDDDSFYKLYLSNAYKAVVGENPIQIHRRSHLQHGAFLCPCDIRTPFFQNLLYPYGDNVTDKIIQVKCSFDSRRDLQKGFSGAG